MSCFVIAEAGVNHNGSKQMALDMVECAADAGADAIKFQTFSADELVVPGAGKADYQVEHTGDGDQLTMLRELEMSLDMHTMLAARCQELGIEFMSTPFSMNAVDYLLSIGVQRIKIGSGELTNYPLLEYIAVKAPKMILSTGMASLEEVKEAVNVIRRVPGSRIGMNSLDAGLTILHCTSNYPTLYRDVNLRAMQTLAQETGLPVGYSDHTKGTLIAPVAVAMGAVVIEKHFTLDRALPGPDHKASLEPDELRKMIVEIRRVEEALGTGVKEPTESELPVRRLVRRSVTLANKVVTGQKLSESDLVLRRPGYGIQPKELKNIVGKTVKRNLPEGHVLSWSDIE